MRRFGQFCSAMLMVAPLVLLASPSDAQTSAPDPKTPVIRQILEETKTAEMLLTAIETNLPAQRAASPGIPAVFWERLVAAARTQRGDLIEALVPIYARNFELSELEGLLAFYRSPLGRRLLAIQPALMRDSAQAGQVWGMQLGMAIGEQLGKEGVVLKP